MAKLFLTVKRVVQGEGNTPTVGAASFAGLQNVAARLTSLLDTRAAVSKGLSLVAGLTSALTPSTPAVRVTTVNSGDQRGLVNPAAKCTPVATNPSAAQGTPAAEVVQIKYDLVGTYGAATATNTTVSGSAWTNPTNAQGVRNGTLASHAGSAASAQDAYIAFVFPAITGKTALTITNVKVRYYVSQTGTVLNNGSLKLIMGTPANAFATEYANHTGDVNFLTTPAEFDLTAQVAGDWANLANLRPLVRHATALGATPTGNVDAVELVVTATHTNAL